MGQAREILSEGIAAETAKLEQRREALAAKAELLRKLDTDIVELVHEDELESEIQHADEIQEIELLGRNIASARRSHIRRRRHLRPQPIQLDDYSSSETATHPAQRRPQPIQPSEEREVSDPEEPHVDPRTTEDSESTPAGLLPPSPHMKLPKLSLKKFGGDLTKWITFWDTFESAIHQNPTLTNIDKFSYLHTHT